jgi:hypothetical protein
MGRGVSRLWTYFLGVPAQNSVIVYNDGSVVEQAGFDNDQIQDPSVYVFILGGTRFRCETGSFEYNALTDAGYTWEEVPEYDVYTETYTSQYP